MSARPLLFLLSSAALLLLCTQGCEDDAQSTTRTPPPTVGAGGTGPGGGTGQGGGTGGDDVPMGGAGHAAVHLSITANVATAMPSASEVLLAELTAYAAGVGAITLEVPFVDHDDAMLTTIEQRVSAYAERELDVILELLIVDGATAYRPTATTGLAWDDPAMLAAAEQLIADILVRTQDDLAVVIVSRRADAYTENPTEAAALHKLHEAAVSEVDTRAPDILTGVGVEFLFEPRTSAAGFVALGDAVVMSYLPGLGGAALPADPTPTLALDAMIERAAIEGTEDHRPVILQAVGYPTADAIASSDDVQLQRLDGFFAALQLRRSAFPYINVHQLHDLDTTACDALLAAQGLDSSDPWGNYMCTTGLRNEAGEPKPGWQRVLEAAAAFAAD